MRRLLNFVFIFSVAIFNQLAATPVDCITHIVQSGETLYGVAVKYKIKSSQILAANPELSKDPNLRIGQKICIPKSLASIPEGFSTNAPKELPTTTLVTNPVKDGETWFHIVQKSESFYGICKTYQILAYDLISANNLPNTIITENQKLILPKTALLPQQKSTSANNEVSPLIEMTQTATEEAQKKSINNTTNINSTSNSEFHIVKQGDTYYNISKRYGLKSNELKSLNNLTSTDIKLGQKLKISNQTTASAATTQSNEDDKIPPSANVINIAKEVEKKETTEKEISINSTKPTPPEKPKKEEPTKAKEKNKQIEEEQARLDLLGATQLKKEVSVETASIQPKKESATSSTKQDDTKEIIKPTIEIKEKSTIIESNSPKQPADVVTVVETKKDLEKPVLSAKPVLSFEEEYANTFQNKTTNQNMKLNKQRGMGELSDAITGNEYLAYYNGCEPGTILKITNLMSKRSTYVKVLGKTNNESMLIVSSKLASKLGVIDNDFLVEVSAYSKN